MFASPIIWHAAFCTEHTFIIYVFLALLIHKAQENHRFLQDYRERMETKTRNLHSDPSHFPYYSSQWSTLMHKVSKNVQIYVFFICFLISLSWFH